MAKVIIDPVTRIEGHLRIDTEVVNGRVTNAWSKGEMFRGFEAILTGRDPFDAPVITQRICGVCPVSHAIAACKATEQALGIEAPENARLMRNLVLGANYLASHLTHFYQLSALDFIRVEALLEYRGPNQSLRNLRSWAERELASKNILPASPFLPHIEGDYPDNQEWNFRALAHYVESLDIRKESHKMAALIGGKMPHTASLIAGGVTTGIAPDQIEDFRTRLRRVRQFVDDTYLQDVLAAAELFPRYAEVGKGVGRHLAYGVFDEGDGLFLPAGTFDGAKSTRLDTALIREEVVHSYYADGSAKHPKEGETIPAPDKAAGYSWLKAPRYAGDACEVGPLSRMLIAERRGVAPVRAGLNRLLDKAGWRPEQLDSVLGRHAARALEASLVAARMEEWLDRLDPAKPTVGALPGGTDGTGEGLTEAPRGALGHWVTVSGGKIANYQCIVPSTWNFSPAGPKGEKGPVETALINTPVATGTQGLEAARVVRSFDPCIACAIH